MPILRPSHADRGRTRQDRALRRAWDRILPRPDSLNERSSCGALDAGLAAISRARSGRTLTSRRRLDHVQRVLERFRQSVLAAACSGELTDDWRERNASSSQTAGDLPVGWKSATVGEVLESLKYGTAQKCDYDKRGIPVLRIPNVANGVIDHSDLKYAKLPSSEREQLRLTPGDILLIRSNGSVSLVGRTALVRQSEEGFAYAGYLIRLRPRPTAVTPEFLNLALGSFDVRLQVELEARSTSGVHNINGDEVRALRFALPPRDEQREILMRVNDLVTLAGRMDRRLTEARGQVEKLTAAILAKAFRGELVPTEAELAEREGREYEPASVLLTGIAAHDGKDNGARGKAPVSRVPRTKTTRPGDRRSPRTTHYDAARQRNSTS